MAQCPKHRVIYWGRCEHCADENRKEDERRIARGLVDKIAQLERQRDEARAEVERLKAENTELKGSVGSTIVHSSAWLLKGMKVQEELEADNAKLRARLALADRVAEVHDTGGHQISRCPCDAHTAWREGRT